MQSAFFESEQSDCQWNNIELKLRNFVFSICLINDDSGDDDDDRCCPMRSDPIQLCDVILEVNGEKINAHRVVLASVSPYFYAMFNGM